jgi:hypothetical protein
VSYYTSVRGEISIEPPIPWGQIQHSWLLPDRAWSSDKTVKFWIDEERVTTDDGVLIRKQATAILPVQEDPFRARDLEDHVNAILAEFGAGREFHGRFDCSGESDGDLWRLEIQDGRAVTVHARIVWPDGSEGV